MLGRNVLYSISLKYQAEKLCIKKINKCKCLFCALYRSAVCFLGVFLITKTKKKARIFEPCVTLNMSNGLYKF